MSVHEILASLCASSICLGIWAPIAAVAGFLAHRRMVSVERTLGARALPPDEWPYLWYAGASVVWLAALVLAIAGLANRSWARLGRNCTFLFLAHMTVATLAAIGSVFVDASGDVGDAPSLVPLVVMACVIVAARALAAAVFVWRFAGARVARIEALSSEGAAPGLERWAVYGASALVWFVGIGAAAVYGKPENVRVGATALRISVVALTSIALVTCVALAVIVTFVPLPM